jgi:hypothetical protein
MSNAKCHLIEMLTSIKQLFLERKVMSLSDLSLHFGVEESALEKMLDILIKKDFIKRSEPKCDKGMCSGCSVSSYDPSKLIFYSLL